MVLAPALKKEVMDKFKRSAGDTGSPEVQVALITRRIEDLAEHFKTHQSDHHSRQGLLRMVNKRRKLLDYIKQYNMQRYRELISGLGLRR